MGNSSEFSQICVPPIIGGVEFAVPHSLFKHISIIFSLGTSDDFSNLGHQSIKSSHSFIVRVQFHIKRFDFFWEIVKENRAMVNLLGEVFFVFLSEIIPEFHLSIIIFKTMSSSDHFLKFLDCFGIVYSLEFRVENASDIVNLTFFNSLVEKLKIIFIIL